jgi:hypothetical protein
MLKVSRVFKAYWEEEDPFSQGDFADPGGNSALRAGARIYPCPTCERPNMLTAKDNKLGYQCDRCADALEGGYGF